MTAPRNRLRLLNRIAQVAQTAPTANSTTVIPPPPAFQASSVYPGIRKGFNSASVSIIDGLVSMLNMALQYASEGSDNFQTMRSDNFIFDASGAPSADQRNIMAFSQMVYHSLLNSGNDFQQLLNSAQIADMVKRLEQSQSLNMLSQTNPTGQLAQKVPGNLQTNILSYLQYLVGANPATQR